MAESDKTRELEVVLRSPVRDQVRHARIKASHDSTPEALLHLLAVRGIISKQDAEDFRGIRQDVFHCLWNVNVLSLLAFREETDDLPPEDIQRYLEETGYDSIYTLFDECRKASSFLCVTEKDQEDIDKTIDRLSKSLADKGKS